MGLKDANQLALRIGVSRGLERRLNFRGVMRVIVDDNGAAPGPFVFKASRDPGKVRQTGQNLSGRNSQFSRAGGGGEGVHRIMPAWDFQLQHANRHSPMMQLRLDARGAGGNARKMPVRGRIFGREPDDASGATVSGVAGRRAVGIGDNAALCRDLGEKFPKAGRRVREGCIRVKMVGLDVGHAGQVRPVVQKMPPVFAGFDDDV